MIGTRTVLPRMREVAGAFFDGLGCPYGVSIDGHNTVT